MILGRTQSRIAGGDHPPGIVQRMDCFGKPGQRIGYIHRRQVIFLRPLCSGAVGRQGRQMLRHIGQIAAQIELIAEFPRKNSLAVLDGGHHCGGIAAQKLHRLAVCPAPASKRLIKIIRHSVLQPEEAGNQADFQFLRAGNNFPEQAQIGIRIFIVGADIFIGISAAVKSNHRNAVFFQHPKGLLCLLRRKTIKALIEQIVAVDAGHIHWLAGQTHHAVPVHHNAEIRGAVPISRCHFRSSCRIRSGVVRGGTSGL